MVQHGLPPVPVDVDGVASSVRAESDVQWLQLRICSTQTNMRQQLNLQTGKETLAKLTVVETIRS
jgi:hypothetical protein